MYFSYVYEKGTRAHNQDAILVRSSLFQTGKLSLIAICDGMGGMDQGERASDYVIRTLDAWFDQTLIGLVAQCGNRPWRLKKSIQSKGFLLFRQLNDELFSQMRLQKQSMGTTASVLISYRQFYFLFHIGDSRIYQVHSVPMIPTYYQLTKDHSKKQQLTRCIGLNKEWRPDFRWGFSYGGHFLLCTDGFYRKRCANVWERCLDASKMQNEKTITKRLRELATANLKNGETDNMSAVYVAFHQENKKKGRWM